MDRPLPTSVLTRRRMLLRLATAGALVVAACGGETGSPATATTRTAALDIALQPVDGGEPTSLAALRGTPVVVNIWATWCVPCRTEMPAFESVHRRLGDRVRIIGVTDPDDAANIASMIEQTGVTYPLFVARDGNVQSRLEVTGLPATYFLDERGVVVERHQGALTAEALSATIERHYEIS